jgi:predicted membrane protein
MNSPTTTTKHGRGFGLILILLGVVLLAGNLGFIPQEIQDIIFRWPMIFVAIGLAIIFKGEWIRGLIFLAIGSFFMLPHLITGLSMDDIWIYWPVLLILGGLLFWAHRNKPIQLVDLSTGNKNDLIDEVVIFGGNNAHFEYENFRGGRITSIFGGSEISFAGSKLDPQGAVIDITALFGGSKIVVPRDWKIKVEVLSIFGGVSDKRPQSPMNTPPSPTLLIKGVALFGGGEITSF